MTCTFNKKSYLQRWFDKLNTPTDTLDLQGQTLKLFLLELGYQFDYNLKDKSTHIRRIGKSDNPEYMSLENAVRIYNYNLEIGHCEGCFHMEILGFTFDNEVYIRAYLNKLITNVYLRRERGEIRVSSHWVEFNKEVLNND